MDLIAITLQGIVLTSLNSCTVWLTGLSGSGKTTLANALKLSFENQGKLSLVLDGDHRFFEVYLNTPITICENRDPKLLYKNARIGKISNFHWNFSRLRSTTSPMLDTKYFLVERRWLC